VAWAYNVARDDKACGPWSANPLHRGSGVLVLIATFHASGRPGTVSRIGNGLQGLLRPIAWSFGLALAILLLIAPTTAKAADPDDGGSLLGGLTGGLADAAEPVADVVEPVTDVVEPVASNAEPVTALVTPLPDPVEQVVQPVSGIVGPVLEPVVEMIEPVTQPLVDRLGQPIATINEPVTNLVTPVVEPIDDLVEGIVEPVVQPVLQPVSGLVGPVLEPITGDLTSEPSAGGDQESGAPPVPRVSLPNLPTAGIELPRFMPISPLVPGDAVASQPSAASEAPVRLMPETTNAVATVADARPRAILRTPPAADPGSSARSPDPGSAAPWWTRLAPIASFAGVGSGQTLNGFAFGVGAGLGLLVLLLLPPPFRVSRLHLAAVFWRPQRFVGPLVPPG
jgi:hypothetical protein